MTISTLIRCVLCQGTLPGVQDEVFLAHMRDHHRAFHNMDFMFAASSLTDENIGLTLEFINMTNNDKTLENETSIDTFKETKFEPSEVSEDIYDFPEKEEEILQNLRNESKEETKEEDIKVYQKRKRKDQSVKCQYCDKLLTYSNMFRHIKRKHGELPFQLTQKSRSKSCICLFCGKEFANPNYLYVHAKVVHDEEKHACDLCGKELKGIFNLNKHKKLFHKQLEPCPHCGKMVKRMTQHLKTKHLDNEEKKYQCQTCGKGFVRKHKLQNHERTHSKIKPYLCRVGKEDCGHRSSLSGNRNKHEKLCKFNIMK